MLQFKAYDPSTRKDTKGPKRSKITTSNTTDSSSSLRTVMEEFTRLEESDIDTFQEINPDHSSQLKTNSNCNTQEFPVNIIVENTHHIKLSCTELVKLVDQELNSTTSRAERQRIQD